ncbi:MAG TPA: hypothetical protein VJ302_05930 [Blastocatellia bacterium]|nr:hypothetical protein [Blastocatellia bacterium]
MRNAETGAALSAHTSEEVVHPDNLSQVSNFCVALSSTMKLAGDLIQIKAINRHAAK